MALVSPISVDNAPRVVAPPSSPEGQYQAAVAQWANEVALAIQQLNTAVQKIPTASSNGITVSTPTSPLPPVVSTPGLNGWSPVLAIIIYSGNPILAVVGWVGGTGIAPASPVYVGASGFVTNPSQAVNFNSYIGNAVPYNYASSGNIQVTFLAGTYGLAVLAGSASFSPGGSLGVLAGASQVLDINNSTGGTINLTWNSSWQQANGFALPSTLAAGAWLRITLRCIGASDSSVVVSLG